MDADLMERARAMVGPRLPQRLAWDNHGADLDDVLNNFAHHIAAAIRNLAGPSVPPSKHKGVPHD